MISGMLLIIIQISNRELGQIVTSDSSFSDEFKVARYFLNAGSSGKSSMTVLEKSGCLEPSLLMYFLTHSIAIQSKRVICHATSVIYEKKYISRIKVMWRNLLRSLPER
jgi:hypothetical protein